MVVPPEAMELLKQKGVAGVSDPPEVVRIYVETIEDLEKLPSFIAGYSVEAIVSGRFLALQNRKARMRPAKGGISIGHYAVTAGTLSTRVFDKSTRNRLILSNNHVLANSNIANIGDAIYQPGTYDGGTESDTIATLERFVTIQRPPIENLVDCAVAKPINDSDLSDEILDIGVVNNTEDAIVGMIVEKSGRTSGYNTGNVQDINATIKVYGYPWEEEYAIFSDQIITTAIAEGGDSGSLVVNIASGKAVGLLFAGSSTLTAINKTRNVCDLLSIDFGGVTKGRLTVTTTLVSGDIYVNDSKVGTGSFTGELDPGIYKVSFGNVSGYTKPSDRNVQIIAGMEATLNVTYIKVSLASMGWIPLVAAIGIGVVMKLVGYGKKK